MVVSCLRLAISRWRLVIGDQSKHFSCIPNHNFTLMVMNPINLGVQLRSYGTTPQWQSLVSALNSLFPLFVSLPS